jgi:hypothetical protein
MTFRLAFAVAIAAILVGGPAVLAGSRFWTPAPEVADKPVSGMALLNSYRCRRGETRRIVVKGIEDGFSPEGVEPSNRREALSAVQFDTPGRATRADYDQSSGDGYVLDYFDVPPNVARALFVIGLKPVLDDRNDTLMIGDFVGLARETPGDGNPYFYEPISKLSALAGWTRSGPLAWVQFSDIPIEPRSAGGASLLDQVRSGQSEAFDVRISDDTAVDFMGIAYCEEPGSHGGLTVAVEDRLKALTPTVLLLSTNPGPNGVRGGDPFLGDADCREALPLLCFRDQGKPAPAAISDYRANGTHQDRARHWTGGTLRLSAPVRGSDLATVADADRRCASAFGAGWRVADFHAGGAGTTLSGLGQRAAPGQRAWVDIKDQPYGTCWKRAAG